MRPDTAARPHRVYRCFNDNAELADDTLLYVGCTVDLKNRMSQHRKVAPWFHLLTRVESAEYADRATGLRAEASLIRRSRPLYNFQSNGRRVFEPPTNDECDRLTLKEAAGWTGIHLRSMALYVQHGWLPSADGKTVMRQDIVAWIDSWPDA